MGEHTATVERLFAAYNAHDAAGFACFFAEDGRFHVLAVGEIKGRDQIEAATTERWRALDYTLDPTAFYESGDDVFVEWSMTGTHIGEMMDIPATNRGIEGMPGCSHFTFDADGLVASDLVYFDSATMMRQLGLLDG